MVLSELQSRILTGSFEIAGNLLSTFISKTENTEETTKIKEEYYNEMKDIARQSEKKRNRDLKKFTETPVDEEPEPEITYKKRFGLEDTQTEACIACSKNHLSAAAGLLAEGKRFLKQGITSDEITSRIDMATQEITAMERGDLHPSKVESLPLQEKRLAEWLAQELRNLRHTIDRIKTPDDYKNAITESSKLSREMTKRYYELMSSGENIEGVCRALNGEEYEKCIKIMNSIMTDKKKSPL